MLRLFAFLISLVTFQLLCLVRLQVLAVSIQSRLVNIIGADLSSRLIRRIALQSLLGESPRSLCSFPSNLRNSKMTWQVFRAEVCQVRFCHFSRHFDVSCFYEVLCVQVLHFHVPCSLGQSLRQSSSCFGVASQVDLGSHAEIVQHCFHSPSAHLAPNM